MMKFDQRTYHKAMQYFHKASELYYQGQYFKALNKCHKALTQFEIEEMDEEVKRQLTKFPQIFTLIQ